MKSPTLRRKQSTWIERWWFFKPMAKGLIKTLETQAKGIKFKTILGIGLRIKAERNGK